MRCSTTIWPIRLTATIPEAARSLPGASSPVVVWCALFLVLPCCRASSGCSPATGTTGDLTREHLGETWQLTPPAGPRTFRQAETYCEELVLGGRDDWRLPGIDELRALIVDCPDRELGGACRVSDNGCLDLDCHQQNLCGHCNQQQGPDKGCYWQPGLWEGSCTGIWFYWSSSAIDGLSDQLWVVRFQGGGLLDDGVVGFNEELGDGDVRCIAGDSDGATTAPPRPEPGGISLGAFCEEAIAACTSVGSDECAQIVVDADKLVQPADITCASAAKSCDDTAFCLDELSVRNLDGAFIPPDQPTSMPAGD